ncbi:CehA/McbA family metallohydrolase domain-containing protein [Hymenobacter crusticola]|uniref:Uncharacterized protein n=1 Tax=Hymenobacter crusticola TaxID=1770526 RepID=A0A243WEH2_9BACT|nr:hypothetical protein [Hymenobacter crusticola]OUJ73267.1 hypothetical protein BXP70_15740 [Hymenobacter crusticola]
MKAGALLLFLLLPTCLVRAQQTADLTAFNPKSGATALVRQGRLEVSWPASGADRGKVVLNLTANAPLFRSIQLRTRGHNQVIARNLEPAFILTVGKRDLVSQNGWNIFFDKVPQKPFRAYRLTRDHLTAAVSSTGARTTVTLGGLHAPGFSGQLELTLYHGSPLFNVAAVLTTSQDSTAILYDAGLVSAQPNWRSVGWATPDDQWHSIPVGATDSSRNVAVKYRTVLGETAGGSLAVFPAPHQYFYPLDEAFNLKFTWFGTNYRQLLPGYGLGIRQDLYGDKRYVPWFNAPPNTAQRLHFYCLLGAGSAANLLTQVKRYTHDDTYATVPGYKTMASHFHNEYVMQALLAGKPEAGVPEFVRFFKSVGLDIVHLGEFHYTAHPKGPDDQRLRELATLFELCRQSSDEKFLLLPGEEPNEFLGGHWLALFPRPVYWVMARKPDVPFVQQDARYGTVYHVGDKTQLLDLLQAENGLAWTAHARTKGSVGYPDEYRKEAFFTADRFLGAAWKALPADLSQPRLGKRALDLLDDLNNWGTQKKMLAEADLFTVNFANEMYAHLNVNYVQLPALPAFQAGWQPVLDALQQGRFFCSTGEVLIPQFTVAGKSAGETAKLPHPAQTDVTFDLRWTFPLAFAEIISGDGQRVYRQRVDLSSTQALGQQVFHVPADLTGKKWVRLEAWDVAANGAFTQTVYLVN